MKKVRQTPSHADLVEGLRLTQIEMVGATRVLIFQSIVPEMQKYVSLKKKKKTYDNIGPIKKGSVRITFQEFVADC